MRFEPLRDYVERTFGHMAEAKHLEFRVDLAPDLPPAFMTDPIRLQQILKNLLSNAFKFTEQGSVRLDVAKAAGGWSADNAALSAAETVIAFSVSDTGVGIAQDKLLLIFEAFQQADGTTSRRYGGTGLGLSISRELARLLGGEIVVESAVGKGSRFTLYIPFSQASAAAAPAVVAARRRGRVRLRDDALAVLATSEPVLLPQAAVEDDRAAISGADQSVLIVEDDPIFARILLDTARDSGFKGVVTLQGSAAVLLAREFQPRAVLLDLTLPDIDGWAVLDQLKRDADTRHIPVHILSGKDARDRALRQGAFSYLIKPVARERLVAEFARMHTFNARTSSNLLIVEDNETQRRSLVELLAADDVSITEAATGARGAGRARAAAFRLRRARPRALPDVTGFELLKTHRRRSQPAQRARGRVHRQGPEPQGGHPAAAAGAERDREGRALARAPARRDRAVPASPRDAPVPRAAAHARGQLRLRQRAERKESPGDRRRRAQHLRADHGAGAAADERVLQRERQGRHRDAQSAAGHRHRPDGHHDAGDGRLRHHARDPRRSALQQAADHHPHGEGDEGRSREVHRGRALPTTSPSRWTPRG